MITFSGLLNALDGVVSSEERIIFMTTNHIDSLDEALIRPGRVDFKVLIDRATLDQAGRMFLHFYNNEEICEYFLEAVRRASHLQADYDENTPTSLTPAQIQGYFIMHKDDPKALVEHIKTQSV